MQSDAMENRTSILFNHQAVILGPEKFIRGHSSKPSGDYGANRTLNSSFPRPMMTGNLIPVSEGSSSGKQDKVCNLNINYVLLQYEINTTWIRMSSS